MYYAQTNLCFVDLQILFTKSSVQGNANSMNFFFFFGFCGLFKKNKNRFDTKRDRGNSRF